MSCEDSLSDQLSQLACSLVYEAGCGEPAVIDRRFAAHVFELARMARRLEVALRAAQDSQRPETHPGPSAQIIGLDLSRSRRSRFVPRRPDDGDAA